ncbi:nuclear transport factor 2 family protein [Sphingomonas bacterium]|uniref:nuclear transport factor 2 family protein n=1 Tax=Sphingomonas bacterium TaxID=1895847 RepID=UPI001575CD64|nr:nuclear transport factor 2 family protein [Sphingomonas bacterium]
MTDTGDIADRLAIDDLVTRFFNCLDRKDVDSLPALFADGARLDMGVAGRPAVEGRDAIKAAFGGGGRPGRRTRHHWFALMLAPREGGAQATFQAVVYASDGDAPTAKLANLSDTALDLVRDPADGSWRIAAMARTVVFHFD